MKTEWEVPDPAGGRGRYCLRIEARGVASGHDTGHPMDTWGQCSHREFLAGAFHDTVLTYFGEAVLAEAIEAVRRAPEHPPFREEYERAARLRAWLDRIPADDSLRGLATRDGVERGADNYRGTVSEYRSGDRILRVFPASHPGLRGYSEGRIVDGRGKLMRRRVDILFPPSHGVGHDGYFFLCVNHSILILDPDGKRIETEQERQAFGDDLRIASVFRYFGVVAFLARWFHRDYPDSLLRYVPGKGWVGRGEPA